MSRIAAELDDATIAAERARIIGSRRSIEYIAKLNGESVRNVYKNLRDRDIPYIKIGSGRYVDPTEYAEKRVRRIQNAVRPLLSPPRPVGRPRKLPK